MQFHCPPISHLLHPLDSVAIDSVACFSPLIRELLSVQEVAFLHLFVDAGFKEHPGGHLEGGLTKLVKDCCKNHQLLFPGISLSKKPLSQQKLPEATAVFELNVAMYPDSWNVYDSLGEAYKAQGELDLAISNYERSIEINPENENGKQVLGELATAQAKK